MKIIVLLMALSSCFASTLLKLDPSKRITAKIGKDSMNRICVENDRIFQVFGDSECYEIQTEEGTGQIFVKPTQENGIKPLSMTLITENGITQDLKLIPAFDTASSIVLKGEKMSSVSSDQLSKENYTFKKNIMESIKSIATGNVQPLEEKEPSRTFLENVSTTFVSAYQINSHKGYKYKIKNETSAFLELSEKDFFTKNDKAVAFEKSKLKAGESTFLYIICT